MAGRYDRNPFDEDDVNPFAGGGVPPASNSRMPPLPHEPAGFYNDHAATVDIPLGSTKDLKQKEKELQSKEAELNKRERVCVFCLKLEIPALHSHHMLSYMSFELLLCSNHCFVTSEVVS